jgi:hypothetical protein
MLRDPNSTMSPGIRVSAHPVYAQSTGPSRATCPTG